MRLSANAKCWVVYPYQDDGQDQAAAVPGALKFSEAGNVAPHSMLNSWLDSRILSVERRPGGSSVAREVALES